MGLKGSEFYDNNQVFDVYMNHRRTLENPNDTMEKPILLDLIGDVKNLHILDLGCGDAGISHELFEKGCSDYNGIEGSKNMYEQALQTLKGTNGKVTHNTIENWNFPKETYNLVISRLVLHYINDIDSTFQKVYQSLKDNGRFVFSVEHPVITSCNRSKETSSLRKDWIVDDYFNTGERIISWMGGEVVKYHRTIEDYFVALQKIGFSIEVLKESRPLRKNFINEESYLRRMRTPLFLFFAARK